MAIGRIVKFVLRLAVAAAVVVGGYFLIRHFTTKGANATEIIDKNQSQEIAVKYEESYEGLAGEAPANSPQKTRILTTDKINAFLLEYYDHYLTLTAFQSKESEELKNEILKKTESLADKIANTKKQLAKLKEAPNLPGYEDERAERLKVTANFYFEQTKEFFALDELLKDFVIATNYGSKNLFTIYEIQLEVVKDYAKYVFDNAIYGKFDEDSAGSLILDTSATSFTKVLEKFNNRQVVSRNSDKEAKLILRYPVIQKSELLTYFSYVTVIEKAEYINSLENQTTRQAFEFLNDYLAQENY